MKPGRAAAALPAKLARARPRACRCFFSPILSNRSVSRRQRTSPTAGERSNRVEVAMPIAVRIHATANPCSRNRVRMRSASVESSWRSRLNVSRILLIWDRRVALFVKRASSLACLSSSMSESTLSSFQAMCDSVSNLSLHFSIVCFRQFLMLPGEMSFNFGFSVVDTRQLCQVVCQLTPYSRHCLFEPSQLSSGLGDPHGVDWLIINRRFNFFCIFTCAVGYARLLGRGLSARWSAFTTELLRPFRV